MGGTPPATSRVSPGGERVEQAGGGSERMAGSEQLAAVHGLRTRGAPAAAVLDRLTGAGFKLEGGALGYVCAHGFADCALLLCERGAAIDQADCDGDTPLLTACMQDHTDCALLLCERGAAINQASSDTRTPLSVACLKNNRAVVQLLCEWGI